MTWVSRWIRGAGLWQVFQPTKRFDKDLGAKVTERASGPKKIQDVEKSNNETEQS